VLVLELHSRSQSKVSKLDIQSLAEEYVAEFEIAMQNLPAVQISNSPDDLGNKLLTLWHSEAFALINKFIETLNKTTLYFATTHFEKDVHVLLVLETDEEFNDIGVMQGLVYLDLVLEFVACAWILENAL